MKVGILTFHRAHNYGAVLQCYALQEVIKRMGYDVEVIDYRQPHIEAIYSILSLKIIWRSLFNPTYLINYILRGTPIRRRKKVVFSNFRDDFIGVSKSHEMHNDYDVVLIGSDQLWNQGCTGGKFDLFFFGSFPRKQTSRIVGYAISASERSIGYITTHNEIGHLLNNFTRLSMREQQFAEMIGHRLHISCHVDIDPTLLAPSSVWEPLLDYTWEKRRYILVYYVPRRFGENVHSILIEKAKALGGKYGAEVIDLSSSTDTVGAFVTAMKYSLCTISTSFHGTVFSIRFNRPLFPVMLHDGGDARMVEILKSLDMQRYLVDLDFEESIIPQIDYQEVNRRLSVLRESSFNYLKESLDENKW